MTRPEKLALLRELVSTASAVRDLVRDSEVADGDLTTYNRLLDLAVMLHADREQWGPENDILVPSCDPGRRSA